jgi:hypothetical protein
MGKSDEGEKLKTNYNIQHIITYYELTYSTGRDNLT